MRCHVKARCTEIRKSRPICAHLVITRDELVVLPSKKNSGHNCWFVIKIAATQRTSKEDKVLRNLKRSQSTTEGEAFQVQTDDQKQARSLEEPQQQPSR